jgi:hypothetical protein
MALSEYIERYQPLGYKLRFSHAVSGLHGENRRRYWHVLTPAMNGSIGMVGKADAERN